MKRHVALIALALCLGCDDRREEIADDWSGDTEVPRFAPAPSCPLPGTPHAVSYQESGGASNAWLWWMTVHALSQPSYRETHHVVHHYTTPSRPRIVPIPVTRTVSTGRSTTPVRITQQRSPASSFTKSTTTTTTTTRSVPKSSSYGFRAPVSRPPVARPVTIVRGR